MNDSNPAPSQLNRTLDFLEEQIVWNKMAAHDDEKRQVNVRIGSYELDLLDQLAKRYETNRTAVAQHLLQAAIHDACEHVGIDHRVFFRDGTEHDRVGATE